MKTTNILMVLLAMAVLASCESEPNETLQANIDTGNVSTYDPANGIVPFPVDLLFQGTLDGTLNIPVDDPADLSDPQVALNALDGFSTNAPFSAGFAGPIDPSTVTSSSVRVFEVALSSTPGGAVVNIIAELVFGVDFLATVSSIDSASLVILPLKPLKPKKSYEVVITNGLKSVKGNSMLPSTTYALAKSTTAYYTLPSGPREPDLPAAFASFTDERLASLEGLRQLVATSESFTVAGASPALTKAEIILSWSFTTQSVGDVLSVVRGLAGAPATSVAASTVDLDGPGPLPAGITPGTAAAMYEGTIDVPYYLEVSTSANDPTALTSYWKGAAGSLLTQYNKTPVASDAALSIPILITIPTAGTPPWKTVIFQHGITSDRSSMLGIADSLAAAGFAVVAIDLPMHGVNSTSPFYSVGNERTFDLDLVTQDPITGAVTAYAPDGVTDSSGTSFINLQNLLNTRDNVRQAVADLFALTAAISSIDVDGGGADLDGSNIYFVGHSLGAIVGTPFLALELSVKDAVLAMGGSAVAKILDGSASFGSVIADGLAANGVLKGTSDYESFLGAAQTVVDSADPVNYSLDAAGYSPSAAANRGLLFFEVVGDSVLGNLSDLVVPNTVPDANDTSGTIPAPLAGTEPQLALLGLTQVNATIPPGGKLLVTTKYIAGTHSSLLDPAPSSAVTTEMQTEAASFLGSGGTALTVDNTVLQAP